jgi:hypothetical protein
MLLDITKSQLLVKLLKEIVANLVPLSAEDRELHECVGDIKQFFYRPNAIDPEQLISVLNSAKDIASSYVDYNKQLPSMLFHCITELEHLKDSKRLSAPLTTAQLILNIDKLAKLAQRPL